MIHLNLNLKRWLKIATIIILVCEEMGSAQTSHILHTKVRELFQEKILIQIFEYTQSWIKRSISWLNWSTFTGYLSKNFTKINEPSFRAEK